MFKIDKSTHMLILFTFALVFVVVYLYFTITDLRKVQKEVKRLSDEVAVLKTQSQAALASGSQQVQVLTPAATKPTAPKPAPPQPQVVVTETKPAIHEEDKESVATEEIRDALDVTDDEEDIDIQDLIKPTSSPAPNTTPTQEPQEGEDGDGGDDDHEEATADTTDKQKDAATEITLDVINKMRYEDLREYCRKHGLNQKGNKDVLVKRITDTLTA